MKTLFLAQKRCFSKLHGVLEMLNTYVQGARFDASVSYRLKVFEFFTDRQPIDALANPYSNAFTLSR